jgi:prohibitin 2
MQKSPAFLELRRLESAREIATGLATSRNKIFLDSEILLLNITKTLESGKTTWDLN